MLSSRPPASAALGSLSLASSSSPVSVLLLSSITTSGSNKGKDELLCQVADNFPSNLLQSTDPPLDAIVLLNDGTMSKTLLSCNPPKVSRSGLTCVQCVEVFPDTMNHCVPEWDADGREMDVIWEPTDLFSPSKGKWDSGHMRKSDPAFVPEHDFEELCWEDGQLLVVMQGLNGKCNMRNRNGWQVNAGETAPVTSELPTTGIDSTFDTVCTAELVDPSTVNMHSQEDELLSWLQHPPEDLVDKLEIPSDTLTSSTLLANGERLHPMDLRHCGIRRNLAVSEGIENNSVSKTVRKDNSVTFPINLVNKSSQGNYGVVVNQHHVSTLARSSVVNNATITSKDSCESSPVTARVEVLPTQVNFASVGMPSGSSDPITSTSTMNFSNFLRPAVAFKANLHSLGMANGPSAAERLKQLDRVAVDALSESIDSTTKHRRLIAPRRDGIALPAVSTFSQSVRGPFIHNSVPSFPLQGGAEQDASATGAVNRCFGIGGQSDSWNSSLISNTNFGTDRITEVLEVAEPSDISSSGGSEESDGVDGKRGASMCKRKFYDEDIEIQSKALENGALGGKIHTTGGGSNIKKSRAAENHNRSERRRRDRITEKMRALQALVPNSHKTDKASMLEEAIAYIKALKAQIQMMSCRGGMYFSPMLLPQGMQHVQMAAWPHMGLGMGMNMGMGTNATMGMFDMHMAMAMAAAAPRQFTPMMTFPGAVIPAVQMTASTALESARLTHGVQGHVIPSPPSQMMAPVRPELPEVGTCDSSPAVNVISPMSFPASKQQRPVQVCEPALLRVDHVT